MEPQERDRFVQTSYILMVGYLFSSIISSIGTIIVVRLISVEEYSLLNISYIIPTVLIVIGELGLNYASTYFIAKNIKEKNFKGVRDVIKINLTIKIAIALIFSFIIILFSEFIAKEIYGIDDNRLVVLIQLASIGIISTILYDAINSIFLGGLKVKLVRIGTILRTSLRASLSVLLIIIGYKLLGPMLGFVLSTLIVVIIYLFFLKNSFFKENIEKEPVNWNELLKMLKYGYPLLLFSLIISIRVQSYVFILLICGFFVEISYFTIAIVSGALMGILTKSVSYTLFPIFSKRNWNNFEDREKLIKTFQFSLKFCSLIILPVAMLFILFSNETFPIIFGEKYREASPFISTYFLIFLLTSFGSLSIPAFLNGQERTKYVLYIEVIKYLASVIFALIMISFYGGLGLVYGIVIGTIISVIYGNIVVRKKFGENLFNNLKNIIIIFLIAIICAFFTFLLYNYIADYIHGDLFIYDVLKLLIAFSFYIILFLFLIGILSQITIEELNFFIDTFERFPLINKIVLFICNIEKKILRFRN